MDTIQRGLCNEDCVLLRLLKASNKADKEKKFQEQKMIEELCNILKTTRSTVWEITHNVNENKEAKCEIIAGVPLDRNEHGFERVDSISKHPDVEHIFNNKKTYLEENPADSELTSYFNPDKKNISQILYVPLFSERHENKIMGVLVVDAMGDRQFTNAEIESCKIAGKLVSIVIIEREDAIQRARDEIGQQIVAMELSLERVAKYVFKLNGLGSTIIGLIDKYPTKVSAKIKKTAFKFIEHGTKTMGAVDTLLSAYRKIEKQVPHTKQKIFRKD